MTLKLVQPGGQPLGQFDGLDTEALLLKGGEVVTFKSVVATSATDLAAKDAFDGYVNPGNYTSLNKRTVVTKTLVSGDRPLMLADEGIAGYGTLFGSVVGGTTGQNVAGTVLGPSTASGSGKVTCWEKPGVYAVSLDACDTNATTGLTPTNVNVDAGSALYATTAGLLTPTSGSSFETVVLGRFINFESGTSLVTTPNSLVGTLNAPDGVLASTSSRTYTYAVFYFNPPSA